MLYSLIRTDPFKFDVSILCHRIVMKILPALSLSRTSTKLSSTDELGMLFFLHLAGI